MALAQINKSDKKVKPSGLQRAATALGMFTDVLGGVKNISDMDFSKAGDVAKGATKTVKKGIGLPDPMKY